MSLPHQLNWLSVSSKKTQNAHARTHKSNNCRGRVTAIPTPSLQVAASIAGLDRQQLQGIRVYLAAAKQLPYTLSEDMVKQLQVCGCVFGKGGDVGVAEHRGNTLICSRATFQVYLLVPSKCAL
jgi:hypothetical protein